jgi:hypothetical protein
LDDSIEGIKTKQWNTLLKIKNRDYIINTYISLAFRHLNSYGYSPSSKQSAIVQYIKLLEIFSDKLCIILKKIGEHKDQNKSLTLLLTSIRELYREEAFLLSKFNLERLKDFDNKRSILISNIKERKNNFQTDLLDLVQLFFDLEETASQLNL